MNRGFENAAKTGPVAQKGKGGFSQGQAMANQRKKPTDKAVGGTTNSNKTGAMN